MIQSRKRKICLERAKEHKKFFRKTRTARLSFSDQFPYPNQNAKRTRSSFLHARSPYAAVTAGGRVGVRRARVPARVRGEARVGRGGGDAAGGARQRRQAAENRRGPWGGARERGFGAGFDARGREG